MFKSRLLLTICASFLIVFFIQNSGDSFDISSINRHLQPQKSIPTYSYAVDGFEIPGEWNVRFSRFRSDTCGDTLNDQTDYQDDSQWFGWFVADGKNLRPNGILPEFVYRNASFFKQEQKTILGLKACWDKKAFHSITLEPVNNLASSNKERYSLNQFGRYPDDPSGYKELDTASFLNYTKSSYVAIPAFTREISIIAWINNYNRYSLAFHVEDEKGMVHILDAGYIKPNGWHKLSANIPYHIHKANSPLKLRKIKLTTNPVQPIDDNTYIYFDFMHAKMIVTDPNLYGKDIERPNLMWQFRVSK